MPQNIYSKLDQSGLCPGKFYGTGKMHIISTNNVDELPLHPIVSNIRRLTYQAAKYLAKLWSQLGTFEHTISNTKTFVKHIRKENVLLEYEMVSFDVT